MGQSLLLRVRVPSAKTTTRLLHPLTLDSGTAQNVVPTPQGDGQTCKC